MSQEEQTEKGSRNIQSLHLKRRKEKEKKTEKNSTTFKPFLTKQRSSWQHEMLPYFVYLSTQRKKQVGTSEGIKSWFFAD